MTDVPVHPGVATDLPRAWEDGAQVDEFKSWTAAQAAAWQHSNPRVLAAQFLAGLVCGALAWGFTRSGAVACSALYGAAVVVLPGALLARGMTRGTRGAAAAAVGFLFWEMLKLGVVVAMLAIAMRVVPHLSWPAMLVAMVVCLKVNWLALLWRGRRTNKA